jgi:hypothetical protein
MQKESNEIGSWVEKRAKRPSKFIRIILRLMLNKKMKRSMKKGGFWLEKKGPDTPRKEREQNPFTISV